MSSRKNRSPEEQACRARIRELLQVGNIGSMEDIQNLFKETIAEFMEDGLDAELDEALGYSKYDDKNKDKSRVLPRPFPTSIRLWDTTILPHFPRGAPSPAKWQKLSVEISLALMLK